MTSNTLLLHFSPKPSSFSLPSLLLQRDRVLALSSDPSLRRFSPVIHQRTNSVRRRKSFLLIQGVEYGPCRAGQARVSAEEEEGANVWGKAQRKSRTVILWQQQAVRSAQPSQTLEGCSVNLCLLICQVFFPSIYEIHYFKIRMAFSNYSLFLLVFGLISINQNMYISGSVCKFMLAV